MEEVYELKNSGNVFEYGSIERGRKKWTVKGSQGIMFT